MAISYKKLFKMLIDRDMKKKDFRDTVGISAATVSKLVNGENVTMEVIERICLKMNCSIEDVVEIIPDPVPKEGLAMKVNDEGADGK